MSNFHLKAGYKANPDPVQYCDSLDDSRLYQVEVYRRAGEIAEANGVRTALDIGCGMATKLMEYIHPRCESVTGVDTPETIQQCRTLHPSGTWIPADLEDPAFWISGPFDLVISSDVIEHMRDPDQLLRLIRGSTHERSTVVLSTPERDLRRGPSDMGPPANPAHVREWNAEEFLRYLASRGFLVTESDIVDLRPGMRTCHLVVGGFQREFP